MTQATGTSNTAAFAAIPAASPGGGQHGDRHMNLNLSGRHLDVTPAIRSYVIDKLGRVTRHFDQVIDLNVILSVEKLEQKVEVTLHVAGRDIHAEASHADMYAAIDVLADKLDRQVVKHKEKVTVHRHDAEVIKRQAAG